MGGGSAPHPGPRLYYVLPRAASAASASTSRHCVIVLQMHAVYVLPSERVFVRKVRCADTEMAALLLPGNFDADVEALEPAAPAAPAPAQTRQELLGRIRSQEEFLVRVRSALLLQRRAGMPLDSFCSNASNNF